MEVMPQALVNAKVPNHKKEKYMDYPEIAEAIAALDRKFAGAGRVLIRPSGTEPLVRVMIEGKDQKMIDAEALKLAELIALSSPSPVVFSSRKITCPDCSPPRLAPISRILSSTYLSPTFVCSICMPFFSPMRKNPRLLITVATIVFLFSLPCFFI